MGWVQKRRDHGGVIFLDLRDRSGVVQVVLSPDTGGLPFQRANSVRAEFVLAVRGQVRRRPPGTENPQMATGEVEVATSELEILNTARALPFHPGDAAGVDEALRLRYRYLDLRRQESWHIFTMRHRAANIIRDFLSKKGFLEMETPMLTRSTPEGARDYLVPSRVHPGEFFALPQSPQLFKQILMIAGFERYFQFARCFRDEDLRADRQPEFTQLDLEMSFVDEHDIQQLTEELLAALFQELLDVELTLPFPHLTYQEAMGTYGSDRPDLRFGLEMVDVSSILADSKCRVFAGTIKKGGVVKGIRVPGAAGFSRKILDELTSMAVEWGAHGLAWFILEDKGVRSPLVKLMEPEEIDALITKMEGKSGDLLLFVADQRQVAEEVLGKLRLELAGRLDLIDNKKYTFIWITDFPLLEYDENEQRLEAVHHPFTSPLNEDLPLLESQPERVRARAYDIVLNGVELGGGSIRIHRRDLQERIFGVIGLEPQEAQEKFGFFLEALDYGAPPHGGIAFGFDRLLMLMLDLETIRDVIPFPKTQRATCLLTSAPAPVIPKQLRELHIQCLPAKIKQD
ncbi:aspartyl-tRNA synthetase [Syntrophaceticus schinkii]|uniref:Aspartate--tRNA(Asp/Asn) ligase n=1 Tax=Syntrophaceticus schinkii TaxID=499207 RepID=A0A0B7MD37_9FIRM|nr:aspartyl-tRNA synthetase [Syntrophaceticus schinkii]